jgi:hypothetical protein
MSSRHSADFLEDPLSVAERPPKVQCGPPMPDLLRAPLAGKRPSGVRPPHPVEVSRDPSDLGFCVIGGPPIPLNLALGRTGPGCHGRLPCQSPPPRYVHPVIFPGPATTQSPEPCCRRPPLSPRRRTIAKRGARWRAPSGGHRSVCLDPTNAFCTHLDQKPPRPSSTP